MNKWIILIATIFMTIGFSTTITTTMSNPSGSNLLVSGVLGLFIIIGLWMFSKADKTKKEDYNGFGPVD